MSVKMHSNQTKTTNTPDAIPLTGQHARDVDLLREPKFQAPTLTQSPS